MAPIRFGASNDGPRLTVAAMLKNPNFIPERTLRLMENQFVVDGLFRQGPPAQSGAVGYTENQPMFADNDPEIVEEYGEIPVLGTSVGAKKVVRTVKKAGALVVSREMRDRNDAATLRQRMELVKNTFVRHYDKEFMNLFLNHPDVPTQNITEDWVDGTNPTPRKDIATAMATIENASVTGLGADHILGFQADTLVIPSTVVTAWLDSDEINEVFAHGVLADEQLRYTGKMPRKFFGLDVVVARALNGTNKALVLQRGVCGFISDERPLEATPMYEKRETETWRADFTRRSVAALDQPKAAVILNGVES
jgi:hypothetical protein